MLMEELHRITFNNFWIIPLDSVFLESRGILSFLALTPSDLIRILKKNPEQDLLFGVLLICVGVIRLVLCDILFFLFDILILTNYTSLSIYPFQLACFWYTNPIC